MPFDREFWSGCEGQTIDSVYPLDRCVRVTADGAVFASQFHGRPAAIRLATNSARLAQWDRAAELAHPSLVEILARGEDTLAGQRIAYLVMERPDDNLADVLTDRPLTVEETLETIPPVLAALRYLESQGLAHADLAPGAVLAFGEQIKIGCDDLVALDGTTAAAQSRAIAMLIEKMLGGVRIKNEPLASIVKNCRRSDNPWTLAQIDSCLRGEQPEPQQVAPGKGGKTWMYAAAAVAVVALTAYLMRPSNEAQPLAKPQEPQPAVVKEPAEVKENAPAVRMDKPSPVRGKSAAVPREPAVSQPSTAVSEKPVTSMDGVTQVMPEIPAAARKTINGRVRINVRVQTDNTGRVTQATLLPPGASKYFTDRALAAAKAWNFPPDSAARDWTLRFELSRQQTTVSVSKSN